MFYYSEKNELTSEGFNRWSVITMSIGPHDDVKKIINKISIEHETYNRCLDKFQDHKYKPIIKNLETLKNLITDLSERGINYNYVIDVFTDNNLITHTEMKSSTFGIRTNNMNDN